MNANQRIHRIARVICLAAIIMMLATLPAEAADEGMWSATAPMLDPTGAPVRRETHVAALLPDGRVLVAGGYNDQALASAMIYDPVTESWSTTESMADARRGGRGTLLADGRVLVSGGRWHNGSYWVYLDSAEIFDPDTETWTPTGDMNIRRHYHTLTLLNDGRALAAGGYYREWSDTVYYHQDTAELYDPATGLWTPTDSMTYSRSAHTATRLADGRVLVAGGWGSNPSGTGTMYPTVAEIYDPDTDTWSDAGTLNEARSGHAATLLLDGRVLVAGGESPGGAIDSAEIYDPATNTWTLTGSMSDGRRWLTATLLPGGYVLVAGGGSAVGSSAYTNDSAEIYDPATGLWTLTDSMDDRRENHSATLLQDGRVLVAGGRWVEGQIPVGEMVILYSAELYYPISVNHSPEANADDYSTDEDTPLEVPEPGVLDNDSDPDEDLLTATLDTPPDHGTVTLDLDGSFIYTPTQDYSGIDGFTYQACDDGDPMGCSTAEVMITVTPVQDPPAAAPDEYSTDEDTPLEVPAGSGVLANDIDPDDDPLTASLESLPDHGSLTLNLDGSFVYTPTLDFSGSDGFTYQACDDAEPTGCNTAAVSIDVMPIQDLPEANDDSFATMVNTTLQVGEPGVLSNDLEVDGEPLSAVLVSGPLHGGLELQLSGSFAYTPTLDYVGSDGFTYQACDDAEPSGCSTAAVTITVSTNPVNLSPLANDDAYSTLENTPLAVPAASGVLANDTDPNGDPLTATLDSTADHGTVILQPDGSFVYTPTLDYSGSDGFTYQVCDDADIPACSTADVTLTVTSIQDIVYLPVVLSMEE